MKNKILITGVSGFIGSFLAEEALVQGYDVYGGIRSTSSKIYLQEENIHLLELDLSSKEKMKYQLTKFLQNHTSFDYVVHNAGTTYAKKKSDYFTVNCKYMGNLVYALSETGVQLKKFILISSLSAFGPGNDLTYAPIQLSDIPHPVSTYGQSKLCAERFLKSIINFPYLIINPTAVYGPRDRDFLQFVRMIKRGWEPYIGRNKQMVSFVYVKDLVRAVIRLLASSEMNRSYIVSDGMDYNKEQLGETIRTILKKKAFKVKLPANPVRIIAGALEWPYRLMGRQPFLNLEKVNEISSANWLCNSRELWEDLAASPQYYLAKAMEETILWYEKSGWL